MANPAVPPLEFDPNAALTNSGYDIGLFLDSKDANRYLCAICQCVFKQPYNIGCNNEHVFCKGCLDNYFNKTDSIKSCPSCRETGLSISKVKPSKFVERLVNSLKVKCAFQLDQNESDYQCVWSGVLSDLDPHMNMRCPLGNVICDYCYNNMKRYQIKQHDNICTEKPMVCNQCSQEIKRRLLEEHSDNKCPMNMLSCDECKENVLRKDMEKHLLSFCPEYEIMCNFQQYGCDFRAKRTLMDNHMKEKELEHLRMKVNIIENELKKQKTLNAQNMTWNEYVSAQELKEIEDERQCVISYINGHDMIYENNGNKLYVNVLDMGMKTLLKEKKIFKDTQFGKICENWSEETGIKMENLLIYNYTERKNKTIRTNREIKLDLNSDKENDDTDDYLFHVIERHNIKTEPKFKYVKSIYDRIGNIQEKKRMFMLFDKTKVKYLKGSNILIALKYFNIFEQKLYFVDWLLVKTGKINFDDIMKYIETKLIVATKDKRHYFDVLYNFLNDMKDWEQKTGQRFERFVVYEEEAVLRNKLLMDNDICKVNELELDDVITDEYFDGDIFIFQLNALHPYNFNTLKSLKDQFEERGVYWYDNVSSFLESELDMTWIQLNIRENTGWKTRWTNALVLKYKNDNNICVSEDIDEEIMKRIFKSKHKWYVQRQCTYGMIRNKLGYYYNINPNHIEIWLPQKKGNDTDDRCPWDYGSKGRGKWNDKLDNLLIIGPSEWNEQCSLKFEIQTYETKDFDEMTLYNALEEKSNDNGNFSERIKELAMFNFEIIAPNKASSECGNMTMSCCKNWTTKYMINNILKKVIENPIFGYTFFSKIVEYIRENEMDSDEYMDDISILKSLSADRFLICDEKVSKLPIEYYMNKEYKMPEHFSRIKYTDFRVQFLATDDPLILNKKNETDENENKIDDTKALWFYIHTPISYASKKTNKIRVVIEDGQTLKDVIIKYLKPFLKIDYDSLVCVDVENDQNNENKNDNNDSDNVRAESNDDMILDQIWETHKFQLKNAGSKMKKGHLKSTETIKQIDYDKMYMVITLPMTKKKINKFEIS